MEYGARAVQLVEQGGQSEVLGAGRLVQEAHGERPGLLVGVQAGVAPEQGLKQAAGGVGIVQLGRDRGSHGRLGAVGDHAQSVHQQAQRGGQGLQPLGRRQLARLHVVVGRLARLHEALDGAVAGLDAGVQLVRPGPGRIRFRGALAPQVADGVAFVLERLVDLALGRVDDPGLVIDVQQRVLGQCVKTELGTLVLEVILLGPAGSQQPRHLLRR